MANCDGLLTGDILNDCDNAVVGGIEVNVLLFNLQDINKTATTFNVSNNVLMTNFELKSGKTGYLLEGVKQVNVLRSELVKKEFGNDKEKHTFSFVVLNPTAANKKKLYDMNGGQFAVMVELKWKGASSAEAFVLGGYDSGMEMSTKVWASNENDGTIAVELTSVEGYEEPKPILTVLMTDYAGTKTAFDNKFAEA